MVMNNLYYDDDITCVIQVNNGSVNVWFSFLGLEGFRVQGVSWCNL